MFPITDRRDRIIAFGGRQMGDGNTAKYINSPDTPIFHKGRTLYNLAGARKAAYEGESLIVGEGYMDVIALVRAGFSRQRGATWDGFDRTSDCSFVAVGA